MGATVALLRLVASPVLAALLLTWWLVGDLSEAGGEDRLFSLGAMESSARLLGVGGVLLGSLVVTDLVRNRRLVQLRTWLLPVGIACAAGLLAGAGLRLVSARTAGANIGGGFVLLVGPPVVLALLFVGARSALRLVGPLK